MQCLTQAALGGYVISSPQPTQYTTCTYILAQPTDLAFSAWSLTATQGSQISLAIGLCWATAYAFRVLGQYLNQPTNQGE